MNRELNGLSVTGMWLTCKSLFTISLWRESAEILAGSKAREEEVVYPEAICDQSRKAGLLPTKKTSLPSTRRS
jgi:hypothetical protein